MVLETELCNCAFGYMDLSFRSKNLFENSFFVFTDDPRIICDFSQSCCFRLFNKELSNLPFVMYS